MKIDTYKGVGNTRCRAVGERHARGVPSVVKDEFTRWMAKYEPVERAIMVERERREERRQERRCRRMRDFNRAFADLCDATEGRAVIWRKEGFCSIEMAFEIAVDPMVRKTAERYFRLSGGEAPKLPRLEKIITSFIQIYFLLSLNLGAVISCCAVELLIQLANKAVNHLKHRAIRPFYYESEATRRKALAADRRRIVKRRTTNDCPTKEAILDAYIHRKDSKEAAIYFGSIIHDLECYVDNSLRIVEGRIIGRNQGIKGWLQENIPALGCKYTTIMRYKAMAKKLKQIVELKDPVPAAAVLMCEDFGGWGIGGSGDVSINKTKSGNGVVNKGGKSKNGVCTENDAAQNSEGRDFSPNDNILRGIAIYRELTDGVKGATQMMARIDAFLDPYCVEEATTLAVWREKYKNEITVRNKSYWWRRLRKVRR